MYKAEILADSMSPHRDRLTTMKITFPRFILAEFNTHRMFSRNSASSRAIPFKKMVQMVEENPFIPIAWQKDHKGMQGSEYITDQFEIDYHVKNWIFASKKAIGEARCFYNDGVTKQLCNRLLEPFMWHTVIVTATEWENFFALRCPQYECSFSKNLFRSKKEACQKDAYNEFSNFGEIDWLQCNKSQADIHIQAIAELMWDAYNESTPKQLQPGEWHIPFGDNMDINLLKDEVVKHWCKTDKNRVLAHVARHEYVREEEIQYYQIRQKIATARCARISYQTLGDNPKIDYEADLRLHDMLAKSGHWSPFEHVARAMSDEEYKYFVNGDTANMNWNTITGWCRNFKGFIQYRHLIENN